MSDKVSIIVPVFNTEEYVSRCLQSILAQTYDNIEIIVVDDGSTDGSAKVLASYRSHRQIRVISQANGGLSLARNRGLDAARGDWVMFVDSDDAIHPELVDRAIKSAQGEAVDFVKYDERNVQACDMDKFNSVNNQPVANIFDDPVLYYLRNRLKPSACVSLYRRHTLTGIRFTPNLTYEDLDFTWRYLRIARRGMHMAWQPYNYVQSERSITRSRFDLRKLSSINFIIRNLEGVYKAAGDHRLRLIRKRLFPETVKKQILKPFLRLSPSEMKQMADKVSMVVSGLIHDKMVNIFDFSPRWWSILLRMRTMAKRNERP